MLSCSPLPFNIPNLFLNELLFMWPANKFEFIRPVLLKKIRCLCPKDKILISIGCRFIRTFQCRNSKRRGLQMPQMYSCQRKSIWRSAHELCHLNGTARSFRTEWKEPAACCCISTGSDLCFHICPVGFSMLSFLLLKMNSSVTQETRCKGV